MLCGGYVVRYAVARNMLTFFSLRLCSPARPSAMLGLAALGTWIYLPMGAHVCRSFRILVPCSLAVRDEAAALARTKIPLPVLRGYDRRHVCLAVPHGLHTEREPTILAREQPRGRRRSIWLD